MYVNINAIKHLSIHIVNRKSNGAAVSDLIPEISWSSASQDCVSYDYRCKYFHVFQPHSEMDP